MGVGWLETSDLRHGGCNETTPLSSCGGGATGPAVERLHVLATYVRQPEPSDPHREAHIGACHSERRGDGNPGVPDNEE